MARYIEHCTLPYTQEQLFELVADVERYAEFVPWWIAAKVRPAGDNIVHVEQSITFGSLQHKFLSQAILQHPSSVYITSDDRPFRSLEIHWRIQPQSQGCCTIMLAIEFNLCSGLLQKLINRVFDYETKQLIKVFEQRAHELYREQY